MYLFDSYFKIMHKKHKIILLQTFRYVTTNDLECQQSERLGNHGDGGWDMCTVPPYVPQSPCTVYSFG